MGYLPRGGRDDKELHEGSDGSGGGVAGRASVSPAYVNVLLATCLAESSQSSLLYLQGWRYKKALES